MSNNPLTREEVLNKLDEIIPKCGEADCHTCDRRHERVLSLLDSYTNAKVLEARINLIDYILREPTGSQTMTAKQMEETPDKKWRDEVIQYFFNTESLLMNLYKFKEDPSLLDRVSQLKKEQERE